MIQTSSYVTWSAIVSDALDSRPTLSCQPASGSVFQQGQTAVRCSATDEAHNVDTCSFSVTVGTLLIVGTAGLPAMGHRRFLILFGP